MDSELVRFRIDPAIHDKATKVCAELGLELNDVLRSLVTRIARDEAIPFDFAAAPPTPAEQTPFHDYEPRLWGSVKPQIDAEVALAVLARFIALCSTRIDELQQSANPDRTMLDRLAREREEARRLRQTLDVTDPDAVAGVVQKYGPLVRATVG